MVNPMTLAGHVRGGTAQGIGTALYERFHYDDNGQLLTASFMDYLIPTWRTRCRRTSGSAMSRRLRRTPSSASRVAARAGAWGHRR